MGNPVWSIHHILDVNKDCWQRFVYFVNVRFFQYSPSNPYWIFRPHLRKVLVAPMLSNIANVLQHLFNIFLYLVQIENIQKIYIYGFPKKPQKFDIHSGFHDFSNNKKRWTVFLTNPKPKSEANSSNLKLVKLRNVCI